MNGDDEELLEELHQALSQGLDEGSAEVAETMKILWDAEKSRVDIEHGSQMDEFDGHVVDSEGASRVSSHPTRNVADQHGKPPAHPVSRWLDNNNGTGGNGDGPTVLRKFDHESATPSSVSYTHLTLPTIYSV